MPMPELMTPECGWAGAPADVEVPAAGPLRATMTGTLLRLLDGGTVHTSVAGLEKLRQAKCHFAGCPATAASSAAGSSGCQPPTSTRLIGGTTGRHRKSLGRDRTCARRALLDQLPGIHGRRSGGGRPSRTGNPE